MVPVPVVGGGSIDSIRHVFFYVRGQVPDEILARIAPMLSCFLVVVVIQHLGHTIGLRIPKIAGKDLRVRRGMVQLIQEAVGIARPRFKPAGVRVAEHRDILTGQAKNLHRGNALIDALDAQRLVPAIAVSVCHNGDFNRVTLQDGVVDDSRGDKRLVILMGNQDQQLFRLTRGGRLHAKQLQLTKGRPSAAGRGIKNDAYIAGRHGGQWIRLGLPGEIAGGFVNHGNPIGVVNGNLHLIFPDPLPVFKGQAQRVDAVAPTKIHLKPIARVAVSSDP